MMDPANPYWTDQSEKLARSVERGLEFGREVGLFQVRYEYVHAPLVRFLHLIGIWYKPAWHWGDRLFHARLRRKAKRYLVWRARHERIIAGNARLDQEAKQDITWGAHHEEIINRFTS